MEDVYHDKFKDEDYQSGVPEPSNNKSSFFISLLFLKLVLIFGIWFFWDEIKPVYHHFWYYLSYY